MSKCLLIILLGAIVKADIYLHNPRGSNGRGCNTNGAEDRSNDEAERLFDSQNNDKGGYSCGSAYPFACYKIKDDAARGTCNQQNTDLQDAEAKARVAPDGTVRAQSGQVYGPVKTDKMYFFEGSTLPVEWTAQHGAGTNGKTHSEIIIQVGCEGEKSDADSGFKFSFTDDCGQPPGTGIRCDPRDGTAISNSDTVNLKRIPEDVDSQNDYRYGRHESFRFYKFCRNVERNKGLFTADQKLKGNDARFTRQQPNLARNGLECPEESEYYPWWAPSPWIDVAIVTSDGAKCAADAAESQNVKDKFYCECGAKECTGDGNLPNNERACATKGGQWTRVPSWRERYGDAVQPPECVVGAFSRDNHLGNVAAGAGGQPFHFNWTLPSYLKGKDRCVLRLRYNMSSGDYDELPRVGTAANNNQLLLDRDNNPEGVFKAMLGFCDSPGAPGCTLGLAVNTNQYGRTFQDRSHMFRISERKSDSCKNIYNLNVRGKRGNIVQVYPSVEYDFVPNKLNITEDDCVHAQWTGSDYNPNRNPNDAEGGPPDPNQINQGRADRSNLVQMDFERFNQPIYNISAMNMFVGGSPVFQKLAFIGQPVNDAEQCKSYAELRSLNNNDNNKADRDHRNCAKLSGAGTPYFDAGLLKSSRGTYYYMSTRNNNFSNRGQKGVLQVAPGTSPGMSAGAIVGITFGVLAGLALVGYGAVFYGRPKYMAFVNSKNADARPISSASTATMESSRGPTIAEIGGPISASPRHSIALYDYSAREAGELTLKRGDRVEILTRDKSGWWEGRLDNGLVGVFPSNYVGQTTDIASQ